MQSLHIPGNGNEDCIKVKDCDGRIQAINLPAAIAVGKLPEELLGTLTNEHWLFADAYAEDDQWVVRHRHGLYQPAEWTTFQDQCVQAEVWKCPVFLHDRPALIHVRWRFDFNHSAKRVRQSSYKYGYAVGIVDCDPAWIPTFDMDLPPISANLRVVAENLAYEDSRSIAKFYNGPRLQQKVTSSWAMMLPPS